jgi:LacI family transcriptional regulator
MTKYRPRTTLKDVATSVGVSVNAVSIVLNNTGSSKQVSEQTRARILATAKELGYQPHTAAQSLVTHRSNAIGIYIDYELSVIEPFTAALISGASRACRDRRKGLVLYGRRSVNQTADDITRELLSGTTDGVIVASWTDPEILDRLQNSFLPVVHYPFTHPIFPSIAVERLDGARQAVRHLLERGHRRIMYRGFPAMDGVLRADAFARAGRELDVPITVVSTADVLGHVSDEERHLLSLPVGERPTAVLCWNDEFAYRFLDFCDGAGLRVPDDVAVVGYDGARTFPPLKRRLTTVFVPWDLMAYAAVSLLVDLREGVALPPQVTLPVHLQIGDTA